MNSTAAQDNGGKVHNLMWRDSEDLDLGDTAAEPIVSISLALSSEIYRRRGKSAEHPVLTVTTILQQPEIAVVEIRGETDSGTILEAGFRLEHFEFYDLTDSRVIDGYSPFPGSCEPRDYIWLHDIIELRKGQALKTTMNFTDVSPIAVPVRMLQTGHEYRITLKPQRVYWAAKSEKELFKGREFISKDEIPDGPLMKLASEDELWVKVEE